MTEMVSQVLEAQRNRKYKLKILKKGERKNEDKNNFDNGYDFSSCCRII